MAGGQHPQPQYQQGYDPNQQGYDPNNPYGQPEGEIDPSELSDEQNEVTRQLPWMAVAMVLHGFVLLVAAFIVNVRVAPRPIEILQSQVESMELPKPPEEDEPPPLENPEDEIVTDVVVQEKIVEVATDERNEDPTDSPLQEMDSPDSAESPNPNTGPNSAFGFGGGGGGGGGSGGGGGLRYLRSSGGRPGGKVNHDRTDAALQWLADHQNSNGHWSASNFLNDSIRTKRPTPASVTYNVDFRDDIAKMRGSADNDKGHESFNVGLTGLALLAFVGDGHTHNEGKYSRNVNRAIRYIMGTQDAEGCFGARDDEEYVYSHAICAMAIAELYEMTLSPVYKGRAQRAVDFIVRCQNPGMGWRYGVQPKENDTSVTAWMVLALKSAKTAGLEFNSTEVYAGANTWLDRATGKDDTGYEKTGYDRPGGGNSRLQEAINYDMNPSMDACSVMARLFSGALAPGDRKLTSQANLLVRDPARWYIGGDEKNGPWKVDMYYWYYASLALFQLGGDYWNNWERELIQPVLLKYQRGWHQKDLDRFGNQVKAPSYLANGEENPEAGRWLLDEHGSWDPVDPWGSVGGRVYSTAVNALTLEVYYRYKRIQ